MLTREKCKRVTCECEDVCYLSKSIRNRKWCELLLRVPLGNFRQLFAANWLLWQGCSVALFSSLLFSSLLFSSLLFSSLLFSSLGTVCTVIFVEGSGDIGLSNATNLESNFMEMRHAVTTNESVDWPILQHIQPDLMAICTYFTRWLIRTTSLVQIQYFMSCQFV